MQSFPCPPSLPLLHLCMRQGKNRPLDQEEAEFLEGVVEAESARLRAAREEEEAELAAFQAARQAAAADTGPLPAPAGPALPGEEVPLPAPPAKQQQLKQQPAWRPKAAVRPLIKAVAKPKEGGIAAVAQHKQNQQQDGAREPASKRQRTGETEERVSDGSGGGGLAGLLGGYGSEGDSG